MFFKKKQTAKPLTDAPKAAAGGHPKKGGFKLPFGKKTAAAAPAPKPAGGAPAAAKPAGGSPAKKGKKGSPLKLALPILLIVALVGGGYLAYTRVIAPQSQAAGETLAPAAATNADAANADSLKPKPNAAARQTRQAMQANEADPNAANAQQAAPQGNDPNATQGAAAANSAGCAAAPKFVKKLGLGQNIDFDTSETGRLILLAPVPNSDAVTKYQNQSWNQAGFLGAFAVDREGNIYLAPTPRTGPGVKAAPPQNVIYKVDTQTGNLAQYLELPDTAAPSPENPFGILGLAYDCDTNSLYVSSVAGSTATKEAGHIYRVDLNLNTVANRMDNVDALGMTVGSGAQGQVLYFGSARTPNLRAVNLDAGGNFQGQARDVGALADPQRAQRLVLASPTEMTVRTSEFSFANVEIPVGAQVRFVYDAGADKWNAAQ